MGVNLLTAMDHGRGRSPFRPADDCLAATNRHAARRRHRNRAGRSLAWPFRRKGRS